MKRVIITVTNDLETDQRMHKTALNLSRHGFEVLLLGRKLSFSQPLDREYPTHRMRLLFKKGFLFYACYNFRLFLYLLFHPWDIVLSCDMDSLPAAFTAHKMRRKKLVFDSHELFSEVPEIQNKKFIKKVWQRLEAYYLPRVKYAYTVSGSIADYYKERYGIDMSIIRNVPVKTEIEGPDRNRADHPFIIYQGALNKGRGLEKLIDAMSFLPKLKLVIAGDGPLRPELEQISAQKEVGSRIEFKGRLSFDELKNLTSLALLGVSIEEDFGLNYRFALPNKLFDYMQAGIPSIVSDLPEMGAVIRESGAGFFLPPDCSAKELAQKISSVLDDKIVYAEAENAAKKAALVYNWEKESIKQIKIFHELAE